MQNWTGVKQNHDLIQHKQFKIIAKKAVVDQWLFLFQCIL